MCIRDRSTCAGSYHAGTMPELTEIDLLQRAGIRLLLDPSDGTQSGSFNRSAVEVALRPPFFSAWSGRVSPMPRNPLHQRLISIVEPVCQAAGYELIDLRFVLEQGGWT